VSPDLPPSASFSQVLLSIVSHSFPVLVKFFAAYQEAVGCSEQVMEVETGTTAADICDRLIAAHPSLAQWRSQTRFGINLEFAAAETPLQPHDELVLIPPVSGG
jgi:molybdopterin synthase sulfur carrier subunit